MILSVPIYLRHFAIENRKLCSGYSRDAVAFDRIYGQRKGR